MIPETGSTAGRTPVLDPASVSRFYADLFALWPLCEKEREARLGVAVSGGPDSTALLLLATAALPGRVEAVTVDHGLRAESAREAAEIAALCERLTVPHRTLAVKIASGNLQAEARRARYAAMAEWIGQRGLSALATGHHADDQAETLMLRLHRASGVAGLAGARPVGLVPGTKIALLRPLLRWRRRDLAAVVKTAGIAAAQDPSNEDDRFDRARMRKALDGAHWLDVAAVAESASHLADADVALEWAAQREHAECVQREELGFCYRPTAPRAIAMRVIARIVADLGEAPPRGSAIARLFDTLAAGRPASIGNLVARPQTGGWSFTMAPKRKG